MTIEKKMTRSEFQMLIRMHRELNERSYERMMKASKRFDETIDFIFSHLI